MATAATVFRDYETDGVPSSGAKKPKKSEIRQWGAGIESAIQAYSSGAGSIAKDTRAALFVSLEYNSFTTAWVYADPTVEYNGIYRKNGAPGTGSWTLILPLPYSFIIASDVGAGTPNAIQATTSIPVSESALVWLNIFEANTTSPVTVSFNGGAALTIKTNTASDVVAGGLSSGMIVLGIKSGSIFRLVSDQASAAIVAAAEAAKDAAEAAASSMNQRIYTSVSEASSATIPAIVKRVSTQFRAPLYADMDTLVGGARYRRASFTDLSAVSSRLYFRSADRFMPDGSPDATNGGYWLVDEAEIQPEMAGAGNADMAEDTKAWQAVIDFSASHGPVVRPRACTYVIDGYKGAQDVWTAGEWASGGLIVRDGCRIWGAGRGKTILKNGADNWRCVLRVREGRTSIRHLTIDGDIANHLSIELGSTTSTTGSVRGEALIFEGGATTGLVVDVNDCEFKNTGHYGIGVQNVAIAEGNIRNVYFSNTGGDCIDIKQYSTPNYDKNLIIDGVFTEDGCGHNYVGGSGVSPHDNQAVVDIGGKCIVSNVHINGLDSYGTQLGNCGVRLRAQVTSENRMGAAGSQVNGVYVKSTKLASEGSSTIKRIIGVAINCEDVSVSNVFGDGCFWGLRAFDTSDGVPVRVRLVNITVRNCNGAGTDAVGIDIANACRDVNAVNLIADACEIGVRIGGQRGHYVGVTATNNTVRGLDASDAVLALNTVLGISFSGNAADMNATLTPADITAAFAASQAIVGQRKVWQDIVALANDAAWTGDDAWIGGQRFYGSDASGQTGELARAGLRSTGSSGAGWMYEIQAASASATKIPVARFMPEGMSLPMAIGTTITPLSNGDLMFEAASNTSVRVRLKGSDGTVRSATLTLS